jgi:ADP-glucose pyrophosphorylase
MPQISSGFGQNRGNLIFWGGGPSADTELYQASMGIYVFNRQVFIDVLVKDHDDFGKHIV